MTPLVRDMVKWWAKGGNDPTDLQWFDISNALNYECDVPAWLLNGRSPFHRCMIMGRVKEGWDFALVAVGNSTQDGIIVGGSKIYQQSHQRIPSMTFITNDEGLVCRGSTENDDPPTEEDLSIVSHLLANFFESVSQPSTSYKPVPHKANISRAKHGLLPLYDLVTVYIEPVKQKNESHGGTHASPRQHDRRGHFRRTKNGTVWVKNCIVGDPARGAIFHDYAFKEKLHD